VNLIPSAAEAFAAVALCLPDLIAYQAEKNKPVVPEPVVPAE
jgi:hypothetical protein